MELAKKSGARARDVASWAQWFGRAVRLLGLRRRSDGRFGLSPALSGHVAGRTNDGDGRCSACAISGGSLRALRGQAAHPLAVIGLAVVAAVAAVGCETGDSGTTVPIANTSAGSAGLACTPGVTVGCTCLDQQVSTATCMPGGVWGACVCAAPGLATDSAPTPVPGSTAAPIGAFPPVAGMTMQGEAGAPAADGNLYCQVEQLLADHCQSCHGAQLKFGAPMPLLSLDDLQRAANSDPSKAIYELIPARLRNDTSPMPPPPNARLSNEEMAVFDTWLAAGRPQATAACATTAGAQAETDYGEAPADCETFFDLTAHGQASPGDTSPFAVPSELSNNAGNLYQCFYFDVPYEGSPQGLWFTPIVDDDRVVHHWILYGNDGTNGPAGEDGQMRGCNANQAGSYFIAGWAPGAEATRLPDTVGLQLPSGPNARLLLEVHYFNGNGLSDALDRSGVRFCTAATNRRPNEAAVHTLGSEAICLPPGIETTVAGVCDPRDDMGDIHIVSVWPHMHTMATAQRLIKYGIDGSREVVFEQPFSFNTQIQYPLDLVVRPGERLQTECVYRNTDSAPVPYGERTQEEMCYNFVTAWPAGGLALPDVLGAGSGFPQNRCVDPLTILGSCNGALDAPTDVP